MEGYKTILNGLRTMVDGVTAKLTRLVGKAQDTADTALARAVQPDWNQNNAGAPDYVQNRTHWVRTSKVVLIDEDITISGSYYVASQFYESFSTYLEIPPDKVSERYNITYDVTFLGETFKGVKASNQYIEFTLSNGAEITVARNCIYSAEDDGLTRPFTTHLKIVAHYRYYTALDKHYIPSEIQRTGSAGGIGKAGTGAQSEIFNDYAGSKASGQYSHAEGQNTTASGSQSHSEGGGGTASGSFSHTEGRYTYAKGSASHAEGLNSSANYSYSHAEGQSTTANDICAHAEGYYTFAGARYSHAEGNYTRAQALSQHVQGEYNILDTEGSASLRGKYAHIVGNGTSSARSNAHTLDWNGVAWFQGRPQFGGTAQDSGSQTVMANGDTSIVLASSTSGSTKKFTITVDDTGKLTATEVTT